MKYFLFAFSPPGMILLKKARSQNNPRFLDYFVTWQSEFARVPFASPEPHTGPWVRGWGRGLLNPLNFIHPLQKGLILVLPVSLNPPGALFLLCSFANFLYKSAMHLYYSKRYLISRLIGALLCLQHIKFVYSNTLMTSCPADCVARNCRVIASCQRECFKISKLFCFAISCPSPSIENGALHRLHAT